MTDTGLMGAEEASRLLGCSRRTVIRMIEAGKLDGSRVANAWLLNREAVQRLAAERRAERAAELERLNAAAS